MKENFDKTESLVVGANMQDLAIILKTRGLEGLIKQHGISEAGVKPEKREDEAIVGQAAKEFYEEAKQHPERYQDMANYIAKLAQHYNIEPKFLMDFGCGPAILTAQVAKKIPQARIIGADLSPDMLELANQEVKEQGVGDRVSFKQFNINDIAGRSGQQADIVFSRNMLHRLDHLETGLLSMANAVKNKGGIVYNSSFRNWNDLDAQGKARWEKDFHERDEYPKLQEAWVLAYMNAPTLAEFEEAAKKVAHKIDAEDMLVAPTHYPGNFNEVDIVIKKKA